GFLVVVFPFVIWGMVTPRATREARRRASVGTIGGRQVSHEEFRAAYLKAYLSLVMTLDRRPEIDPELDRELRREAWKQLVELYTARSLGLTATDQEVINTIRRDRHFQVEGKFSPAHYQAFIRMLAETFGLSERGFEEHVREQIVLQKLRMKVSQAALVSPFEQQRAFRLLTDSFDLDYVILSNDLVRDKVRLSDEQVRVFYERDPEMFAIPPKVRVKYVCFPVSNYLLQVSVTEEELRDYYDQHLEEFTAPESTGNSATNSSGRDKSNVAAAQARAETKGAASTNQPVRAFEEVREQIEQAVSRQKALEAAADEATAFVVLLAPDREGNQVGFDEAASERGLPVVEPPPFARDEVPDGVSAGLEFTRTAFSLTKAPDEYFSDAVIGTDAVYVIALEEKLERRVPAFEEVKDHVRRAAEREEIGRLLLDFARDLRARAEEEMQKDPTNCLVRAARRMGVPGYSATNVTAASGVTNCVYSDLILRAVLVRSKGELTDPVPADGTLIIAYVQSRKAADPQLFASYRQPIITALRRERGRMLWESFEEFLLRNSVVSSRTVGAAGRGEGRHEHAP
ncbi:MAG TPA: hypothetical protein EYP62_04560, partial [Kiritimatiellae bacterium]|nr:hypothetical protein [Kiritimatiellia bacterium]